MIEGSADHYLSATNSIAVDIINSPTLTHYNCKLVQVLKAICQDSQVIPHRLLEDRLYICEVEGKVAAIYRLFS
jgi:hypothetical protein